MRTDVRAGVFSVLLAAVVLSLPAVHGQDVAAPRRIVSIVPAVTEMLFALGAGDDVVGVGSFDKFPPEVASRPRVGALVDPDFERVLSLKPDLVVVYGTQSEFINRLTRAGVAMFRYEHAGLSDITTTIRALGRRIGRVPQAALVIDRIVREIDEVSAAVAGRPRPATAVLFDREAGTLRTMFASGGIGFMHDMLEIAGGRNVFADVKRQSLQVSAEMLLSRAPEVIVEVQTYAGWTPEIATRERSVWRGLPALPAVRSDRIHILIDDRLTVPGPRVGEGIAVLARALHGIKSDDDARASTASVDFERPGGRE
jgi:iron complex transport system substrate-binding protein